VQEDGAVAQLHKNVGDYHYRAARYDEALDAYQRASKLNPDLGEDVYLKLGNIRYKRGERQEAVESWEKALAIDPNNEIIRTNLDAVRRSLQ
jgi:tetratricopeptide (TPR) repeat protein